MFSTFYFIFPLLKTFIKALGVILILINLMKYNAPQIDNVIQ